MKIAVLSGKGGTGKTTIAASLAYCIDGCQYMDCDVEEPNGYIFMNPELCKPVPVDTDVPKVIKERCNGCGECARVCQFNAIACVKKEVVVFTEICHGCTACIIACPNKALYPDKRQIGVVEFNSDHTFIQGKLDIGEPIAVPVIKKLKSYIQDKKNVILDCPPGASCTVVEAVEDVDFGILVAEPTPFGLHDFKIAVALMKKLGLPFGTVINKAVNEIDIIDKYCREENIEFLMRIPYSTKTATLYSNGILKVNRDEFEKKRFEEIFEKIVEFKNR